MRYSKWIIIVLCVSFACCKNKSSQTQSVTSEYTAQDSAQFFLMADSGPITPAKDDSVYRQFAEKGLFKGFCPADTMEMLPPSKHIFKPFDIVTKKGKKNTIHQFKITNDCCHTYKGSYSIENDTLVLFYTYVDNPCDCYCDYILTYTIPNENTFKHVRYIEK